MPAVASVPRSVDFERICSLPRRTWTARDAGAWADAFTPLLRLPHSQARLRPEQGLCLAEFAEAGGLVAWLPVGKGKTLLAEMLAVIAGALRPILILPGSSKNGLAAKTYADRTALARDWRLNDPPPRIVGLRELAVEANADLLGNIKPDLIIIDEADDLANPTSAAARRIDRYVLANPSVRVCVMTGTPSRNSILGYWHLVCWALRERAPLPMTQDEVNLWALAIDNERALRDGWRSVTPGPLGATVEYAREWYARRLAETPGVVIVDEDSAGDIPLTVRIRYARECLKLDAHFKTFVKKQASPSGEPVSDGLSRWRIDAQLGCGFVSYFDPPPPLEWSQARCAFKKFVRDRIAHSRRSARPLDTELQVARRYEGHPTVSEWRALKPTYDTAAHTRVAWLSSATLETARDWFLESREPGIIWCGSVEFAEALATLCRVPYYGAEGRDQRGRGLHAAPHENVIASWNANKKGFNLQAWSRMALFMPPQSSKWLEQIFGRSHRAGQTRAVTIDVFATSGGTLDGFAASLEEADFARDTTSMTQKLLRAEIVRMPAPTPTPSNWYRWATREERGDE